MQLRVIYDKGVNTGSIAAEDETLRHGAVNQALMVHLSEAKNNFPTRKGTLDLKRAFIGGKKTEVKKCTTK